MLEHLTLLQASPADLEGWSGSLATCYCDVFGGSPWNEAEHAVSAFLDRLRLKATFGGFRMVLAVADDRRLVGFAYGAATFAAALEPWCAPLTATLGPGVTDAALVGAFELVELGVVPSARGRGIGGRLHDAVLAGADNQRAWLMTRPDAPAARALYQSRGWLQLGAVELPSAQGVRLVMTRPL